MECAGRNCVRNYDHFHTSNPDLPTWAVLPLPQAGLQPMNDAQRCDLTPHTLHCPAALPAFAVLALLGSPRTAGSAQCDGIRCCLSWLTSWGCAQGCSQLTRAHLLLQNKTHRSSWVRAALSCEALEGSAGLRSVGEKLTKTQQGFGVESIQGKINFQHKSSSEGWSHFLL